MENLFSFFLKKESWRLFNAYSKTICLHDSDILCLSIHLWIPI
uniref:Photosystem II protein I n=1 Tax=Pteroceltis tatarinowii TaxID=63062 RepID=A0A4D6EUZ5_9ROSA|nr:photosystem II protein I [Pteroceltis tatarinowii]